MARCCGEALLNKSCRQNNWQPDEEEHDCRTVDPFRQGKAGDQYVSGLKYHPGGGYINQQYLP